ncbi:hypothetical protein GLAREA_10968 [Glarea lozoyensis ATCC 20868]|uniref:Uncharacterized protein n=1 Tax=Glarea lozoyensis (strain ATCC 20868 / MF5171) TaxID=1116229 RepID=S3DTM9_GLAL2|nr:uncharacterized protein GLAREA_10968 [Glarea lozoyensis ATCC 20868]EPE35271.1 hypothetical protein GLAREA_10968 [Glarea lozoyensis ATCC 20868]
MAPSRKVKKQKEVKQKKEKKSKKGPPPPDQQRWIYAGVYKGPSGATDQIWYAFAKSPYSRDRYKIVFSGAKHGTKLGNRGVGLGKRYLITWAPHLLKGWKHFLTGNGQWKDGRATAGRVVQRKHLLKLFQSSTFVDPHPDGCPGMYIGPSVNLIHPPRYREDLDVIRQRKIDAKLCYPNTRIPLTIAHIKVDLYLQISKSPLTVAMDFLQGKMALTNQYSPPGYHIIQADRVESAFFHLGWRVDWRAVYKANKHVREKFVKLAVNSRSWIHQPPLQIDDQQPHSNALAIVMQKLRNENIEYHSYDSSGSSDDEDESSGSDSDDDLDDSSDSDGSGGGGPKGGGPRNGGNSRPKRPKPTPPSSSDSEDDLDDRPYNLPDSASSSSFGTLRKQLTAYNKAHATPRNDPSSSEDDDEQDLFVKPDMTSFKKTYLNSLSSNSPAESARSASPTTTSAQKSAISSLLAPKPEPEPSLIKVEDRQMIEILDSDEEDNAGRGWRVRLPIRMDGRGGREDPWIVD